MILHPAYRNQPFIMWPALFGVAVPLAALAVLGFVGDRELEPYRAFTAAPLAVSVVVGLRLPRIVGALAIGFGGLVAFGGYLLLPLAIRGFGPVSGPPPATVWLGVAGFFGLCLMLVAGGIFLFIGAQRYRRAGSEAEPVPGPLPG